MLLGAADDDCHIAAAERGIGVVIVVTPNAGTACSGASDAGPLFA